ncbi:MAG: acyltransferase [Methylococcaceae bacterium]|nr:acyltransferase [Methylococcaceae bacterium]
MNRGTGGRFEELDVLRGIAALGVIIFHYSGHCTRYFSGFPFHFTYGKYGVQLFFVISGFVIYYSLEKSRNWLDFAFSRFSRLYPIYWFVLSLTTVIHISIFDGQMWWGGYLTNMTMIQKYLGFKDIDEVFWTLAVELSFYVVMCILFVTKLLRWIITVSVIWLGLAAAWSIVEKRMGINLPSAVETFLILPHIPFFIAGIMFSLINKKGSSITKFTIIMASLATVWLKDGTENALIAALLFFVFGLAIYGKLKFSVSPITLWLGGISYPLYLVHRNLGYEVLFKLEKQGLPSFTSFVFVLFGVLLLSTLLTYLIEKPSIQVLRTWYKQNYRRG